MSQTWGGEDFDGVKAPTSLGGTMVTVGGKNAFVDYVSPGRVNVQVPSGIASGTQAVVVTTFCGASLNVTVNPVQPGILAPAAFRLAAGSTHGRSLRLPQTGRHNHPFGFGPVTPDIAAGNIVHRNNTLSGFQAAFAGVPATIQFAGLVQGFLGLYQFNIAVPNVAASDTVPFTFSLGGAAGSQTLILPIGN